jgi:hypothetical protein
MTDIAETVSDLLNNLQLEERMDILHRLLEVARAELRDKRAHQWVADTIAVSRAALTARLATGQLPCLSAIQETNLCPTVRCTERLAANMHVKVYINDKEGTAVTAYDEDGTEPICDDMSIFHDADSDVIVRHYVMTAYQAIVAGDSDDFSSYASTMCLNDDINPIEELADLLNVTIEEAVHIRVTYLQGSFMLYQYEYA